MIALAGLESEQGVRNAWIKIVGDMEVNTMENKQAICNELCKVLQMTKYGADIVGLYYTDRGEEYPESVIVQYKCGYTKEVNVTMDSGYAMIKDIMRNV